MGLAFVATRLGFEWTLVARELGVRQEKVEQIQMDHNQNTYHQILLCLQHWRDLPSNNGGAGDPGPVKIQQLVDTLRNDRIEKVDLVEELVSRFNLEITLDDDDDGDG